MLTDSIKSFLFTLPTLTAFFLKFLAEFDSLRRTSQNWFNKILVSSLIPRPLRFIQHVYLIKKKSRIRAHTRENARARTHT